MEKEKTQKINTSLSKLEETVRWFETQKNVDVEEGIKKVKLFGEEIVFGGIDFSGDSIMGICQKGNKKIKVDLESIEFMDITKSQKLWLGAWLKCRDNY